MPVRITWISRKDYKQVEADNTTFRNHHINHGVMSDGQEKSFMDYLESYLSEKYTKAQGAAERPLLASGVNISKVRMELLSLREQLKVISETDILVGMHGTLPTLHTLLTRRHAIFTHRYTIQQVQKANSHASTFRGRFKFICFSPFVG